MNWCTVAVYQSSNHGSKGQNCDALEQERFFDKRIRLRSGFHRFYSWLTLAYSIFCEVLSFSHGHFLLIRYSKSSWCCAWALFLFPVFLVVEVELLRVHLMCGSWIFPAAQPPLLLFFWFCFLMLLFFFFFLISALVLVIVVLILVGACCCWSVLFLLILLSSSTMSLRKTPNIKDAAR